MNKKSLKITVFNVLKYVCIAIILFVILNIAFTQIVRMDQRNNPWRYEPAPYMGK